MQMSQILYQGKYYQVREGLHKTAGMVTFGTESLNNALIDPKTGDYRDKQAQTIDEGIYAFVDDDVLRRYTDEEFDNYINEYYD